MSGAAFDPYVRSYERALGHGLAVSGEDKDYFAAGRARHLARRLARLGVRPDRVLDFGCGIGHAARHLLHNLEAREVVGCDESAAILERARAQFAGAGVRFSAVSELAAEAAFDVVYVNGVMHHVPREGWPALLRQLHDLLAPGGHLALWENNPWSPAARLVMRRIPFDRGATLLWPRAARRLAAEAALVPLHVDFLFIFPRALRRFRFLEALLSAVPLGAQYQLLARRDPA